MSNPTTSFETTIFVLFKFMQQNYQNFAFNIFLFQQFIQFGDFIG